MHNIISIYSIYCRLWDQLHRLLLMCMHVTSLYVIHCGYTHWVVALTFSSNAAKIHKNHIYKINLMSLYLKSISKIHTPLLWFPSCQTDIVHWPLIIKLKKKKTLRDLAKVLKVLIKVHLFFPFQDSVDILSTCENFPCTSLTVTKLNSLIS